MGQGSGDSVMPYDNLPAYQIATDLLVTVRDAKIRDPHLRDQALRAAKNACLNIAEGAGRESIRDKARAYTIARGEATEAAAAVEIAALAQDCDPDSGDRARALASRTIALLSGLIHRVET